MEQKLLLEKELEPIFLGKFPEFPEEVKEFLVRYGPYLMLVAALIKLLDLLTMLGLGLVTRGLLVGAGGGSPALWAGAVLSGLVLVIYLLAFSPLKDRKKAGWRLLYYALLLNLLSSLIQLQILILLIGGAIGFWVLFQIRAKYDYPSFNHASNLIITNNKNYMKDKNITGIIAFFLGGLGIHRFYLGQTGLGILYLVFCWTFIPAIVALIDAIIFWTQSSESFDAKYNQGVKRSSYGQISTNVADELSKLNSLKERGVLTEDEFQARKAKILA
jgi:TM2 domain-containing membrane protein YozV